MGMFDDIKCAYPLPSPGANDLPYQTKDLLCKCDNYEIREDGSLWHEAYETEDRSPATLWRADHPGEELPKELRGLGGMGGMMTPVNKRWEPEPDFIGEVRFYASLTSDHKGWIEWSAYFEHGVIARLNLISRDDAEPTDLRPSWLD